MERDLMKIESCKLPQFILLGLGLTNTKVGVGHDGRKNSTLKKKKQHFTRS